MTAGTVAGPQFHRGERHQSLVAQRRRSEGYQTHLHAFLHEWVPDGDVRG